MKLNISYPVTGQQKVVEIEDERKLRALYDKRVSNEVEGELLGDEFKGYIFKISGGNDKQGFALKQGVLTASRVRLLFAAGMDGYRPRRKGERKRKSTRGCIVSSEMSVVNLVVVKKGESEVDGLTNEQRPRRLGPKRATRIRKLFNLTKADDIRKHVIRRVIEKNGKKSTKAVKIQRLVTPQRLQRKRALKATIRTRNEKSKSDARAYNELLAAKLTDSRSKRSEEHQKRRNVRKSTSDVKTPA